MAYPFIATYQYWSPVRREREHEAECVYMNLEITRHISDKKVDASATPAVPTKSTDTPTGTEGFGLMAGGDPLDIFAGGNSPYQEGFSNGSDLYNDFMNYAQENGELFSGLGDKLVQEGFISMNDYAAMDFRMQKYGQHNPNNVGY